jgi:2-keto-4-pentenoate hydratase/2-oxohepta-3-ene-1,7-dioic acid hydratase in catechol pathway
MRIATHRHQNRRAAGRLSPDGRALGAHALGAEEERRGALAPAGLGIGFNPPTHLPPGDVVRIEIAGIGAPENPVVAFREAT